MTETLLSLKPYGYRSSQTQKYKEITTPKLLLVHAFLAGKYTCKEIKTTKATS